MQCLQPGHAWSRRALLLGAPPCIAQVSASRRLESAHATSMGRASASSSKRLHAFVSGAVQGVFFRAYTKNKALELGLTGWVRNRRDGRVEVTAEGYEEHLQQFLSWLHSGAAACNAAATGSPLSEVSGVESSWSSATGEFEGFEKLWTE